MDNNPRSVAPGPSATRVNMLVIAAAYAVFALSLLCQQARWALTPAYGNLLAIMPQQAWGAQFAGVAVILAVAALRPGRWLSVIALSLGLAITTTWLAAFVIRWLTSTSTTPETWVSWAVFEYLLLWALAGNGGARQPEGTPRG